MIGTTETTIADNCMDRLVVLLWCAAAFRSLGACDWLITSIRRYGIVLSVFVFIKKEWSCSNTAAAGWTQ